MFDREITLAVKDTLDLARDGGLMIATAESCTGGLIAAALTSVAGSSAVIERGFVTYSNEAKHEQLGVEMALIKTHGAVSEQVARAMAEGALKHSRADLSVAVTGVAGPGGGTDEKPVGLVHIASARRDGEILHLKMMYGDTGRDDIRRQTLLDGLALVRQHLLDGGGSAVA